MKQETVHALISAKIMLDHARQLIVLNNQHTCSAGLIFLQDSLEIVFLSCLKELGADQDKSLESFSFDQLMGELGSRGCRIPKSGTLKALNKQRVIVKHYGLLTDAASAATYLDATDIAIAAILKHVIGKGITDVFLSDLLPPEHRVQSFLRLAAEFIEQGKFLEALIEIRKAYFIDVEREYCVYEWREQESASAHLLRWFSTGGRKAPMHVKDPRWIARHVIEPVNYVQIDADQFRLDAIEWGVSTSDMHNISQLTPQAVQLEANGAWHIKIVAGYAENLATAGNAAYCLDRMIYVSYKKHQHEAARRWRRHDLPAPPKPVYLGSTVFERPQTDSKQLHVIQDGFKYTVEGLVTGFDPAETFTRIGVHPPNRQGILDLDAAPFWGFILEASDSADYESPA